MCSKTLCSSSSSPDLRTRPMRKTRKITTLSTKPYRKTRARKHKSLKRDLALSQPYSPDSLEDNKNQKLKNLFPLHPENLHEVKVENENEIENDNVGVAYLFDADGGESLTEFLWDGRDGECPVSSCSDSLSLSPSLTWECGVSSFSLEKTALRHHEERDPSEEKWVCYSEVVEKKEMEEEEEELSCCVPEYWNTDDYDYQTVRGKLLLKLDYQQIINAWSDKGPLFVDGESPQVVPDILDHSTNGMVEHGKVPMLRVGGGDGNSVKDGVDGGESWKVEHRKARVLRYKEKRQNRLFAKRIRYEVRKLNAEKRPRMKGRFVKRS